MVERGDVVVVGAGVVGLAVAFALLERGIAVTVVGPRSGDHAGQATRAAGAMLSTFSEVEPGHPAERTRVETGERVLAHGMYRAWLARIAAAGGVEVPTVSGTWVLAPAGRAAHLAAIADVARGAGHPVEEHDARQVPGLEVPATSAGALWLPTEARVDSGALMRALTAAVSGHRRCAWLDTAAVSVRAGVVACADGTQARAARIVLAAGAGTASLLPESGRDLGVPPVLAGRGVGVTLNAPAVSADRVVRTPNAAFACGVHLVPRDDGCVYLGGTNRLTTTPDPSRPATLDELAVLAGDAAHLLDPALGSAELLSPRVGLRPYTLDHLPLIGPTREASLLLATGTYRCGILLAPRIAALIADEITTPGALDAHPYRALRPMPAPTIGQVLDEGAGEALVEHLLQGGAHLPPAAAREFAALAALSLRALGEEDSAGGAAVRRLWRAAPVVEAVPSLYALARRLEKSR